MEIKVLGPGCARCNKTEKLIREIISETGVKVKVEKVTNIMEIANFGIVSTPAVVVDGVMKSTGKIPDKDEVRSWLIQPESEE